MVREASEDLLRAFCTRLWRLQKASGLTQGALARQVGLSERQIWAILNGRIKQRPDWTVVQAVISACLDYAVETNRVFPGGLDDENAWWRQYQDLEDDVAITSRSAATLLPQTDARWSRGIQINRGGANFQLNVFTESSDDAVLPASPQEFRADLVSFLRKLDVTACREYLPVYLPADSDVTQMAGPTRMFGKVRRSTEENENRPGFGQPAIPWRISSGGHSRYELPADHDRLTESAQPWEQIESAHDRIVVLADPGMGKSWLIRTQTHRLAQAAWASLAGPVSTTDDVLIPIPIRADVLASSPGRTLAEVVSSYFVEQDMLAPRSRQLMQDRITHGDVALLLDALDEVPREASSQGAQTPRKRLEDLLRNWTDHCTGTARCVITSRLAGYSGPPVSGAWEIELLPFSHKDTMTAIQAWDLPAAAAQWIHGQMREPAVAAMARTPLLLALLCSRATDLSDRNLVRVSRSGLYDATVWHFLSASHRSVDQGAPASATDPNERQMLLQVLGRIAITFATTDDGWMDRMSHQELLAAIHASGDDTIAGLGGSASAVLDRLVGQVGVLVPDGNPAADEPSYRFIHRTFAEYLVARHLRNISHAARMRIVKAHQWFDADWAEVIPMLAGLLATERPGDARALAKHFLTQRRDPLYWAFRTLLRIIGEDPAIHRLFTDTEARRVAKQVTRLISREATQIELIGALRAIPMWPPALTDALLSALSSYRMRDAAASALAGRDDPRVTDALLSQLSHDSAGLTGKAAAEALAGRDDPRVTDALLTLLNHEGTFSDVKEATAEALAGRDDPRVTDALLSVLNDSSEFYRVKRAAAQALAGRDDPRVTDALLSVLNDSSEFYPVKRAAAQALAGRDDPRVTNALLSSLADRNSDVKEAAAWALAGRDDPRVTDALLSRLHDQNEYPQVQLEAAKALAGRNDSGVTEALSRFVGSYRPRYDWGTTQLFPEYGLDDDILTRLRYLLARLVKRDQYRHRQSWYVQKKALREAQAGRYEPWVIDALLSRLSDRRRYHRREAIDALSGTNEPRVTAGLLNRLTDRDVLIRLAVVETLAGRKEPRVAEGLLTRLADREWAVRWAAFDALAGRDDPAILIWLCRRNFYALRPRDRVVCFYLANEVADRIYPKLSHQKPWVRRRLYQLTRLAIRPRSV